MVKEKQNLAAGRNDKQKKMEFDNRPCFFRIFFPQIMAQQHLRIPPQFVKDNLKNVTASRAVLTGPSGGQWALEVLKTEPEVFLGDGWQGFVRDNSLQELDFLIFKYDGDMCFTVEIFDKSGCIRGMWQPEAVTPGSGSGLKRGRCQPEDDSCREKNQQRAEVYQDKCTNLRKKLPSECQSGKRSVTAVKEEADSFSSQFPFFEMLVKDYNVRRSGYVVNIPKSFTDKHFLKGKSKVILRSVEGKAWEVNCRVYGGKFSLATGWRSFVDDNKLKVGDVCIFELVGEMELQFHIFNK